MQNDMEKDFEPSDDDPAELPQEAPDGGGENHQATKHKLLEWCGVRIIDREDWMCPVCGRYEHPDKGLQWRGFTILACPQCHTRWAYYDKAMHNFEHIAPPGLVGFTDKVREYARQFRDELAFYRDHKDKPGAVAGPCESWEGFCSWLNTTIAEQKLPISPLLRDVIVAAAHEYNPQDYMARPVDITGQPSVEEGEPCDNS